MNQKNAKTSGFKVVGYDDSASSPPNISHIKGHRKKKYKSMFNKNGSHLPNWSTEYED